MYLLPKTIEIVLKILYNMIIISSITIINPDVFNFG